MLALDSVDFLRGSDITEPRANRSYGTCCGTSQVEVVGGQRPVLCGASEAALIRPVDFALSSSQRATSDVLLPGWSPGTKERPWPPLLSELLFIVHLPCIGPHARYVACIISFLSPSVLQMEREIKGHRVRLACWR